MDNIVAFSERRNKIAATNLTHVAAKMNDVIQFGLNAQCVSGAEVAGVLAQRMGAFIKLFGDNKTEMLRVVMDIMSREVQRQPSEDA